VTEALTVAAWLRARGGSEDVASWAERHGTDVSALWAECPRADWLLAIAARAGTPAADVARGARAVVELALDLLPDGDEAHGWLLAEGIDEVERLRRADALEARAEGAGHGALGVLYLAIASVLRASTLPEAGSLAAALTTQALVLDAGDCAMMTVLGWSQREGAARVRAHVGAPSLPR
jgi:hypothetical protein